MAPRSTAQQRRQTQSQNEHIFALGKAGRKTGLTIPDDGRRDGDGFEVLDNLFSSPDRELQGETRGKNGAMVEEETEEQDMEIDDGSELGPATTRKLQQGRPSLPRARSPIKTNLKSPARQNPHIPPTSSPARGTVMTTRERSPRPEVARKLDFSRSQDKTLSSAHAAVNGASARKRVLTNGRSQLTRANEQPASSSSSVETHEEEEVDEEEEDEPLELLDAGIDDGGYVEDEAPEEPEQEIEEEEEEAPVVQELKSTNKPKAPGRRGRKAKTTPEKENDDPADPPLAATMDNSVEDEEPVKKRKGRPKAAARPERDPTPPADPTPPPKASKRGRPRTSVDSVDESNTESKSTKRQKTSEKANKAEQSSSSKPAPTKEKGKPGRKRKSSGVGVDSPMIQRGPPLPKSRGLVTIRREETTAMKTTRSGRASFKPLEWWRGEHVEYDEDQENLFQDAGQRHFKMPTVKGVVRTEENPEAPRRRGRPPTGRKPGRRTSAVVEEEQVEREDWEYEPGRVIGDIVCWRPEYEHEPAGSEDEVEIMPEELAISENAIQLKDIKDATFKFAKTLTLPFFGSGIVDLPPGAEKRSKNSRMRHLVFFVHTGNVRVTISQSEFGIAKGGMFFVPRGNDYQIQNETDRPARIFFAQGCEILVRPEDEEEEAEE